MNDANHPIPLFEISIDVRWRDLDTLNHVNNGSYLTYLEEARVRWLHESVGIAWDKGTAAPIMAATQVNYRKPLTWPGRIRVQLYVERLGNSSLTIAQRIIDAADESVLYLDGNVVLVWIDPGTGKSVPLPEAIRKICS